MALIKCADCGKNVSDSAPTCPGCGRPFAPPSKVMIVQEKKGTSCLAWGCLAFIVIWVISMGIVFLGDRAAATRPQTGPSTRPQSPPKPASARNASDCRKNIQLKSSEVLAKQLGRSENISLWQSPGVGFAKGREVGEMLPGSRAVILEEKPGDYKVRSPLDRSEGWVVQAFVEKTLFQDSSFKACKPSTTGKP